MQAHSMQAIQFFKVDMYFTREPRIVIDIIHADIN